ncbi:hypothetical protein COR50_08125 [Chitinophaga caeni]|uniref:Response regulatory domain-containing protein n=1 Tax=Chitinophaga caeni TaxID=2029983 RepID=A0A291QTG0_9BACT|nr:response regulator [Chitinophaga caeni]ATL47153.1 hypothetical protein COR50_08125 [Chitinophaga caeni]
MQNIYSLDQQNNLLSRSYPNIRVIVIDDSVLDVLLHKKIVAHHLPGSKVLGFHEASKALEFIMQNHDDNYQNLILLDIQMPVMDGYEFLARLHTCEPKVKDACKIVMISSAHSEYSHIKHPSTALIQHKLPKPLLPANFKDAVKSIYSFSI